MALSDSDYEEYSVRRMMDTGFLFTKDELCRFSSKNKPPGDDTIESYLQLERDAESEAHRDTVQANLTTLRNEVSS